MKYYNDGSLGVVGVDPGPTSGEFTYLGGRAPRYTWIRTDCLYATSAEAAAAEPAVFNWHQPDAVTEGNAPCLAIRERDAFRAQVERWSDELADALGCVNEHSGARQQPCFAEMVEKVRLLRGERDDLMGERELLRCRVAETETEVTRVRNAQLSTLRDQVAMAALPQLLGQVERTTDLQCHITYEETCAEALRIADAFLKERSK